MSAFEFRQFFATRAKQLRIDANEACRVGRHDIAAMLRESAKVYIGCARFADRKVS